MTSSALNTDGPLYRRLAEQLRGAIETGEFAADGPLPAERDLALRYQVSRDTVRKSLKLLETIGVVYGDHGRGTFVSPPAVQQMSRFIDGFSVDTSKRGETAGQTVLSVEQFPASIAIAGVLEIEPKRLITKVVRIRTVDDRPVGLQEAYLNLPQNSSFTLSELAEVGSLYKLLRARFNIALAEALESLGAIAAGPEDASHLNVEQGSPLLLCERVTLSDRRQPIEYCVMRYVSTYRYTTRINQFSQLTK
ncbi:MULTISPECIES: GntR family transcriptional regulator [unclassified Devosia]|uniref:GntR family transcriptional regulator n=1 Tax=unclassified Devosia TaxID=196773 RepID=UPI00145E47C0|nr:MULTISPECIES: GntR family transcriptional regulator [unclassified Devosia]MBJ6986791.1 GntR family transcriptional regulator [Devosia sp. MC521]QMW63826.1 GntR family transcriptional regulator [Devosia sp. MC521]